MSDLRTAAQQALEAMQIAAAELDSPYTSETPEERVLRAAITSLRAALAEPDTCTWQQDGDSDSGVYGTSCRHYFNLDDGTPEDNRMKWCCYCGKKLAQELFTDDSDEQAAG